MIRFTSFNYIKRTLIQLMLLFLIHLPISVFSEKRPSSEPFLSWNTLRSFADFYFDRFGDNLDPLLVKKNDIIYVQGYRLSEFFLKRHRFIKHPYILLTNDCDLSMPGKYEKFLKDPKIIVWFSTNVENCKNSKMLSMPIGIAPLFLPHGNISVLQETISKNLSVDKQHLCYLNYSISHPERLEVYNLLKNKKICWEHTLVSKSFEAYLSEMAISKFVISPRGNGLDCHRTWEALLVGSVPIVKTSSLDPLFDDLPVLIVKNWEDINEPRLIEEWKKFEMSWSSYRWEKLYAKYWLDLIRSYKTID